MKDKVQKIREEVVRIQLYTQSGVLKQVLDYIDEVQKEPVSKVWHDASEETPTPGSNILMIRKEEKDTNYPPIAGCFHGTNFRADGKNWGYYNGFCYNEIEPPVIWAYIDDILNLSIVERTVTDWKEPVSEDLEEAMQHNAPDNIGIDDLLYWRNGFIAGAKWQKEQEYTCYEEAFEDGAKWQKEKDQSTIELAEDHAMLAGMEKMKEEMMAKATDGRVVCNNLTYGYKDIAMKIPSFINVGDKVKVIILKED